MIPRRYGHDALRALRVGELTELVQCAANLERACLLKILAFEDESHSRAISQSGGRQRRCRVHTSGNSLTRGFYGGEIEHSGGVRDGGTLLGRRAASNG